MKIGLMQCKDAILNTVGPNAKGFDKEIITKMIKEQEKKSLKQKKEQRLSGAKSRSQLKKERRHKEKIQKVHDKLLLGQVATDASFLRGFLEPSMLNSGDLSYEKRRALEIASDALEYLEKRKTFWQQTAMCSA